ncbi:MAG: ferritin-like domain-containing protein [Actinobacteria bacterium]|nr:ferritin-like domain-containing protein [Actinomycetota bacterium]
MSAIHTLQEFDVDGALEEATEKLDPGTRASFLKKVGVGAGAVAVGGAFAGAIPRLASAATPASDVAILNFALTLEYLEAAFYAGAKANAGIFKGDTRNFVSVVANHEAVHVAFLKKALGAAAVKKPAFDFKGSNNTNQKTFEATAQLLEDTGVSAYAGQVGLIKTKAILAAAASIHSVEARHAAWMRHIRQVPPAPVAFDPAKTKAQILAAVGGTGFIVG